MTEARLTPRTWYIVGIGLIVSAVTMAVVAFGSMRSTVAGMRRVVVPGRATITLPAGTSTLYAERRSVVDGKTYELDGEPRARCSFEAAKHQLELRAAVAEVSYSIGGYTGRNAWDVDVPEPGDYTLVCEAEHPFVIAIGRGVGSAIVVAVVGIVPLLLGLTCVLIVFFKRRRQRAATP